MHNFTRLLPPGAFFALVLWQWTARPAVGEEDTIDPAVESVLRENCHRCHGEEKTSSRLNLLSLAGMLRGGKRGPALTPGQTEESRLIQLVRRGAKPHMPPDDKQLSDAQIEIMARWVTTLDPTLVRKDSARETVDPGGACASETAAANQAERISVPQGINASLAIDLFVAARWQRRGIKASHLCDDATFARRLYLDLIGRIPTCAELDTFLSDTDSHKRQKLSDQLATSRDYASHMADVFDVVVMGRRDARALNERRRHGWRAYIESSFADNRPWDRMARDMVLARAAEHTDVRAGRFLYERKDKYQEIAEAVSPSFFGIRIECAQCHDHPLAGEIEQRHYWGLVAFFNRGKNRNAKNGPRVFESAIGGFDKFTDLSGESHDVLLTFFASSTIEEARPASGEEEKDSDENYLTDADGTLSGEPPVPRFSRRQKFADDILRNHPLLARAFVNRMWTLFMGRGIVHPVDRMDSAHPPSHPRLLDWLAEDFRRSGYDVKRLVRNLVGSRCYQLESIPADKNALPEDFAYALDKPLTAEGLLNSIYIALIGEAAPPSSPLMDQFRKDFPDVFSDEPMATLTQALLLTNHPEINALLTSDQAKHVDQLLQLADAKAQVDQAFRIVFGRAPGAEEAAASIAFLQRRVGSREAIAHLLWAMMTSAEFRMNH